MIPDRGIPVGKLFFLILLLATVSRFYGLDRLGLWADELWVVMDSSTGSLWDMLRTVYYQDNHPPGYYLLSRATQLLFGSSDFAIRLPSAIAGILLVAATFIAGRKHLSAEAALIAATLVAGSYEAIYYSQEARANIFTALFSLMSLHYFRALALEGDTSGKNFIAFWLCSTLNAYFHYVGLVFTASLLLIYLFILACRPHTTGLLAGIKIFFPVLLLYLPWLPGMYHDLVASPPEPWQYAPTPQTLVHTFVFLFGPGDLRVYAYALVLAGLPLWIIAVILVKPWRQRYGKQAQLAALVWVCILLPFVFFYLKSTYSQSAYNRRHFVYAIPLLSLLLGMLLAQSLEFFAKHHRRNILLAMIGLVIVYQGLVNANSALYSSNHFKQDYRESARLVVENLKTEPANTIPVISSSTFFDHYLGVFSDGELHSSLLLNDVAKIEKLQQLLANQQAPSFYYLEAPAVPAANKMVTDMDIALAKRYQALCRNKFARTQVILFAQQLPVDAAVDWAALPPCVTKK